MHDIATLLQTTKHRPWPLPTGTWSYYQEWNNALFLHWKVPHKELITLVPANLPLDVFEDNCWISLVAFTMQKIRPRNVFPFYPVSNFHEINLRTYIKHQNKAGVYFLNIEAEKQLSVLIAKLLSGLPYEKANIRRFETGKISHYSSTNKNKEFSFETSYHIAENLISGSALNNWLVERYSLYLDKGVNTYRFDIHHNPWQLSEVNISALKSNYKIGAINLNREPDLVHYSKGVNVLSWNKVLVE